MPSWVMVPVPDEHVQEVMEFVIRAIARASVQQWDDESVEEFFRKADEPTRGLLSVVARAANAGKDVSDQMAADFLQVSLRETFGILREVNDLARAADRPIIIGTNMVEEELPSGRTRERRLFTMPAAVAKMVRAAERADALETRPLEG